MKFKIGDRVRVVRDYQLAKKGMTGKVAAFGPNDEWPGIDFGPGFDGHDLHGAIKIDTGYYVPPDYLKLLPEEVREIKPGSKWRNVHGEVTVDDNDPDISFSIADAPFAMDEQFFRMTHEWVSDPVEKRKPGSWVRLDSSVYGTLYEGCFYCVVDPWPPPRDFFFPSVSVEKASERDLFTPCEPPPLVKALDAWAAVVEKQNPQGHSQPLVQALVSEWRALKAKIGGES